MNTSATASKDKLLAIPTNIISGFLGVGKTSAVLSLLKNKPSNERWAVLVNEFGEIGIDGGLISGHQHQQVFVKEVPGGCMCCAAGLPMQIALNQLLAQARPHRLLIEPTGLGHPKEVLEVLSAPHYKDVLDIQKCVTLIDARKLSDSRYTSHDTFNQQIEIADIIVGNKQDLYQASDRVKLVEYIEQRSNQDIRIVFTAHGELDHQLLQGESHYIVNHSHGHHHHGPTEKPDINQAVLPECGYLAVENSAEGFKSLGWRFSPNKVFSRSAIQNWLASIEVERLKGIVITDEGIFGYNLVDGEVSEVEFDDCYESRIEIIATSINSKWQQQLLACELSDTQHVS